MDNLLITPSLNNNEDDSQTLSSLIPKNKEVLLEPTIENQNNEPLYDIEKDQKTINSPIVTPTQSPAGIQASQAPQPKVIDQTEKITSLHSLTNAADDLTKIADEKEQKFIEEVEKKQH
ncbi:hypothetical protein A2V49_04390 [candidate division WWE3 bacterium RBG_19FT_COMBO_34_6]|uniref:Uncharacterized protein n=1 Tax=candidate division WWE3 bacterium RBG_19FT_COMBO_34_6 TaxID=1802612 RepID=A0A1F4UN32_UNCKA|nr:MAG: hypothetical protein A2V49_04390 [candidate division WWE3 bacterium RBG_19FT_COMBO_34_6]